MTLNLSVPQEYVQSDEKILGCVASHVSYKLRLLLYYLGDTNITFKVTIVPQEYAQYDEN